MWPQNSTGWFYNDLGGSLDANTPSWRSGWGDGGGMGGWEMGWDRMFCSLFCFLIVWDWYRDHLCRGNMSAIAGCVFLFLILSLFLSLSLLLMILCYRCYWYHFDCYYRLFCFCRCYCYHCHCHRVIIVASLMCYNDHNHCRQIHSFSSHHHHVPITIIIIITIITTSSDFLSSSLSFHAESKPVLSGRWVKAPWATIPTQGVTGGVCSRQPSNHSRMTACLWLRTSWRILRFLQPIWLIPLVWVRIGDGGGDGDGVGEVWLHAFVVVLFLMGIYDWMKVWCDEGCFGTNWIEGISLGW